MQSSTSTHANNIYSAGLLLLSAACNLPPHKLHLKQTNTWQPLPSRKIQLYLKQCSEIYSTTVAQIIGSLLGCKQPQSQSTLQLMKTLGRMVDETEREMVDRKENESVAGLGLSMIGPTKTSHLIDSKLDSKPKREIEDMLKISGIHNEFQKASTDFPLEQEPSLPLKRTQTIQLL